MSGAHKLYWGNNTNLYRGAAGVVPTDGAMNAANGYEVNGAALATANLADWTDAGVANGQVPTWNAAQAKWTPGTLPSSVNSINGTSGPFTFTGAGVSCTGTTCTVAGTTASGNVQAGSQYSPAFYNQSGSSTTVGGVTPFTGLGYWQTSAPPAAAGNGGADCDAIGTTAVANATNATNATNAATATSATTAASFSGSLAGDVTGTQGTTTVSKINGGAVPVSAQGDGDQQQRAAGEHGHDGKRKRGAGDRPDIVGCHADRRHNHAGQRDAAERSQFQSDAGHPAGHERGPDRRCEFNNYSGTAEWQLRKDASNYLRVTDAVNSLDRVMLRQNAQHNNQRRSRRQCGGDQ